ncbi:PaaI family thioesterase [Rapidithrix thailandica]|uniref:Acyl-coenzyme A thioesterase THEM4 n=1 Tax=Rapidithrix thailandica TaxID=413964 RepID=A0AAW9RXX9_9BACT
MTTEEKIYFQDFMPGNVCFGCGNNNPEGLQIKSYWEGEEAVCRWSSEEKYHGWANLLNGGILATLIDCHCMCSAMAYAYKIENRSLDSNPVYRYATGTITVKYLRPTPNNKPIELRAVVEEVKGKKTTMKCNVYAEGEITAEAQVIAIRVFDSNQSNAGNPFVE